MTFWRKSLLALVPSRHYLSFLNEPGNESFLYFMKLALLIGFVHWALIIAPLRTNLMMFFEHLAQKAPPFVIRNGRVVTHFTKPQTIELPFNAKLIVDTTGETELPPLGPWVSFLITRDQVLVQAKGWLHRFALPQEEWEVNGRFWRQWGNLWIARLTFLSLLFLLLKTLITKFLHYVLASGYAMVLDAAWKLELEYRQLLNVCIYALTPTCLWGLALSMSVYWLPALSPYLRIALYYAVYGGFITAALWQVKRERM